MESKTKRGIGNNGETVVIVENRLQSLMQPVAPRSEFVNDLGRRLRNPSEADLEAQTAGLFQFLFLVAASLVSGALLILLLYRGIASLLASRRLFRKDKTQIDPNCPPRLEQAAT